ncbi:hypothetical protein Tco_0337495 [Tanacetum coccineum]
MATMAENIIVAGAENQPPMLNKGMYDSWKSRILLYIEGNGEILIDSFNNGPLQFKKEIIVPATEGTPEHKRPQELKDLTSGKAGHVDAFDSDCDEEPTASAIFMARLSPTGSINGDAVGPTYDSYILYEVANYDTYHETNMLNLVVQETDYSDHVVCNNDSYDELTSDGNVISYEYYTVTIENRGRVSYTYARGSHPKSYTMNDRIQRPSSRSQKNKVEAQLRKFKSSSNKNSHISNCNANVKNVALSTNSTNVCLSCNECLFSANHDACVVNYLNNVQKRKMAKSSKQKEKFE